MRTSQALAIKRWTRTLTKAIQDSSLDDIIKNKIISKNPIIPHIYGLPKIHKYGCPLRPIVNDIGSPSYGLDMLLVNKFKPLVGHSQSFIKDSSHFIQNIKNMSLRESDIMVSFDVVSLYTKIPVNEVVNIIKELTDEETTNLVKVCLASTYFSF